MAKYIDLILDKTKKHEESKAADDKVIADQAQLTTDQQTAANAAQAAVDSDATLTAAVSLRPQGVRDPNTGIVYQVIGGVLHETTPDDASTLDVP